MSRAVLIIDDEAILAKNIKTHLTRYDYDVRTSTSGEEGLAELDAFRPDIVLLDFHMDGLDGLDVLKRIRAMDSQVKVILMTGHGSVQVAVDAMKAGAHDYLTKPLVLAELKLLLDKTIGQERLEGALAYYQAKQAQQSGLSKLLGESAPMTALKRKIERFVDAEQRLADGEPPTVLITGETGTGKELVARAFHFDGRRRDKPFVEVNCASIPAHLIEAELFGFERGAFTDAKDRKLGLVEAAAGGTLFLDEVGDMEMPMQVKLLKLLEDKTVRRLGSLRDHKIDVRIITATNQDLEQRVRAGEFRTDLFFRLRVVHLELAPLRERGDDIGLLANEFLKIHGQRYGKTRLRFSPGAETALREYSWFGNVRELRNVIEQSVLLAESDTVERKHLTLSAVPTGGNGTTVPPSYSFPDSGLDLEQVEVSLVTQALERTDGNVSRAARLLGLSRDTLRYRMDKYKLRSSA